MTLPPANSKKSIKLTSWGDKSNNLIGVNDLAKYFPRSRFVLVFRDPRGVVSSQAKRGMYKKSRDRSKPLDNVSIVAGCINWRNMVQGMLNFGARFPDRVVSVRFEDFVRQPADTLLSIFDRLGLHALPKSEIDNRLGSIRYRATNSPKERGVGISSNPLERWKEMLTEDDANLISALTGATARKVGYDVSSDSVLKGKLHAVISQKSMISKAIMLAKSAILEIRDPFIKPL